VVIEHLDDVGLLGGFGAPGGAAHVSDGPTTNRR
jgi:hypothetical protein